MSNQAELLDSLRDVREPLPPDGVPLWLPGANLVVLAFILFLLWRRRRRSTEHWRRQLIKDLRHAQQQAPQEAVATAATALRQLMLFRGDEVHTLNGQPWLQHLDSQFNTRWFTEGNGRIFGDSLYRPGLIEKSHCQALLGELQGLIKTLPARVQPKAGDA